MYGSDIGTVASRAYTFEYFTTAIYPFATTDELSISPPDVTEAKVWGFEDPELVLAQPIILSGALTTIIAYLDYTAPIEVLQANQLSILAGNLITTIAYINYSTPIDALQANQLSILSGNLITIIAYINYTTGPNDVSVAPIQILSGSLT